MYLLPFAPRFRFLPFGSVVIVLLAFACSGCAIKEVRGRTAFGPEFRHQGTRDTDEVRYDVRQGLELRWDKGISTSVLYRRRDIDDGSGDNENLVLFEVGYPIWIAPKPEDPLARRVAQLERELAKVKGQVPPEVK